MSDYLTDAERVALSGDFDMVFDTLSKGRTIVVVKEPIKTLIAPPSDNNNLFGMGQIQSDPIYDYTPVSGVFPAMIMYGRTHPSPLNPEINVRIYAGPITIKVKQDCRDYIRAGNNIHILCDDKTFYIDGEERRQLFLSNVYYFFTLKGTK